MKKKYLSLLGWMIALLFLVLSSGCAAFFEDYSYAPVGSTLNSNQH